MIKVKNPEAISWAKNYAEGIKTIDGILVEFCGNMPTQTQVEQWESAYEDMQAVLGEINRLEAEVTPRRMREAVLGNDNGWLANQEDLIAAERLKL